VLRAHRAILRDAVGRHGGVEFGTEGDACFLAFPAAEAARAAAAGRQQAALRDLGHHRLKDLDRPEHLYQLVAAGLAEEFPPLRSLPSPSNLPAVPTSFVGRDVDLADVSELLARPGLRLLTHPSGRASIEVVAADDVAEGRAMTFDQALDSAAWADQRRTHAT
jgi:hypothetical protein